MKRKKRKIRHLTSFSPTSRAATKDRNRNPAAREYRIGDTVNKTLRLGLEEDGDEFSSAKTSKIPKAVYFALLKSFQQNFQSRFFNSPTRRIDHSRCRMWAGGVRQNASLRTAIIDFIILGSISSSQTSRPAVAIVRQLEMSGGVLCALWSVLGPVAVCGTARQRSALAHSPGLNIVIKHA